MLSINPKERPTIWDILNKSFIKKRVIEYMIEIFSGNYPEASLPNDVDDIYIDSLKEQADRLGILVTVREKASLSNGVKVEDNDHQEKKPPVFQQKKTKVDSKTIELEKQKKKKTNRIEKRSQ